MLRLLPTALLVVLATSPLVACDKETKATVNKALGRYRAYDASADGKQQIADAIAQAKAANKRVLVQFGGNWCVFCKALDELIDKDPTLKALHERYVAIHVDAGSNPDLNEIYAERRIELDGTTTLSKPYDLGFPVLLVLDSSGGLVRTQPSTAFQLPTAVGHDPAGVAAFLKQWAGP